MLMNILKIRNTNNGKHNVTYTFICIYIHRNFYIINMYVYAKTILRCALISR